MKIYIPLFYSEKVKRPDRRYFLNNIIGEDFIILALSFSYSSSHPWLNILGLFLLQMAFWCIYELGYIENDKIGEKFEDKAVLSYNYKAYEYSFSLWQPWLWSLGLSILGIFVLAIDGLTKALEIDFFAFGEYSYRLDWISKELIFWSLFLLFLRGLFHVYNHINKQSRVWFYLLLQTCRYCGFLVVMTTNIIGLMLLVSSILTRSIQYILYRYLGGKNSSWPMDFPRYFFCLLIYLILMGVLVANDRDLSLLLNPQVLLISAFCLLRGSKHFYRVCTQFVHVSEDGSNQVS
ncbi:MAG: hypothetical protein QNJ72_06475 [Pleurocapsa sp. MO_226.B13]|nr:hypothetical protein [Pleurocapsa sp. MO_226.B13]